MRSNATKHIINTRFLATLLLAAVALTAVREASAAQAYRYYKFQPVTRRGLPNIDLVQFSELQVSNNFVRIQATNVTNPGGDNPGPEGPANINDNSVLTKGLDRSTNGTGFLNPWILDMGSPTLITEYRWATANDSPDRDPISWDFSGSIDGSTYFLLDRQTNFPGIVTDPGRNQYLPYIPIIRVNNLSPTSGLPAGGTNVTITGSGFAVGPTVTFGGVAATAINFVSATSITCTTPAGTGVVNVAVTNATGATDFLPNSYTYSTVTIGTITWKGTVDSKWSSPGNWDLNRAPASGDTVILTGVGGSRPTNLDVPGLSLAGLTFNSTATVGFTVAPSGAATGITLVSPLTVDPAAGNHTFAGNIDLASPLTASIGAGRVFTISGVISGVAANSVTVAGSGTLALSNPANTYLGTTTVNAGATLSVPALGNVGTPGTLGSSTSALILNGGTFAFTGSAGSTDRQITLSANSIIDGGANALTLTGLVSGASLTKNGSGTLTLTRANSFQNTTVNTGKVVSAVPSAVGAGSITLNNTANLTLGTVVPISTLAGFGGNGTGWMLNTVSTPPTINGDVVTLTDGGGSEARSVFNTTIVNNITSGFVAQFTYNANTSNGADGIAFIVQNSAAGAAALGAAGGGVGYAGINSSFALTLNIYPQSPNIVGYTYSTNGALSSQHSIAPVQLTLQDVTIVVTYDGTNVVTRFTDSNNNTFTTPPLALNLFGLLNSNNGYVGFSGGTGGATSVQTVKNFALLPITPTYANNIVANNTPTLAVAATATSSALQLGSLTLGAGATFNVVPDASVPANQSYSVTIGAGTLNGNNTLSIANNGNSLGSLTLGPIGETAASNLTKTGTGTLILNGASTYTGTTTVSAGTLAGTGSTTSATTVNGGNVAPGTPATQGTLTLKSADFSTNGKFTVRVKAAAQDRLVLSEAVATPALKMGGTSTITIDLTGYTAGDPDGSYVVATAPSWSVGARFTTVLPINNTSGKLVRVTYLNQSPTSKQVIVNVGATVTPVTLEAFTATPEGAGVTLSWNAVSEFQNAGFNLHRRALGSSDWARANPSLIAGRITNPDPKAYSFHDWAAQGTYEYKLESIALNGAVEAYESLTEAVTLDTSVAGSTLSSPSAVAAVNSAIGSRDAIRSQALSTQFRSSDASEFAAGQALNANGSPALLKVAARALNSAPAAQNAVAALSPSAGARWFSNTAARGAAVRAIKVEYSAPGVLLIPKSSLPAGFNLDRISVQREGRALTPLALTDAGLLVYGKGYEDDYTNRDALFLRVSNTPTAAGNIPHAQGLFAAAQTASTTTPATVTTAFHDVYFDYNPGFRPFVFEPWFSDKYLTDGGLASFTMDTPFASNSAASITVNLWSLTATDHALQAVVNGTPIGQAVWSGGGKMVQLSFQIPSGVLNAGTNQVDLVTPSLDAVESQTSFLHSMSMSYTRSLDGSTPATVLNATTAGKLCEMSNVPTSTVYVVDLRYPDRAALIPCETQQQPDGTYKVRFNALSGGAGQYLVVPAGRENLPLSVSVRQVKPVKAAAGIYWAVGPAQFGTGVTQLLAQHSKEGIRGSFIDQEQLFDYYNHGRYGPAGIQNAVRSLRPSYLLLLGRTTYDYKNYSGANVDPMCPAFLVATSFWSQTTSDSMFGDLGRGYPEVAVGRLPVNSTSELSGAVHNILGHSGALGSGPRVHTVADIADPEAGDFAAQATQVSARFPDLAWQPNYLGITYQTAGEVTAAMTEAANGGADWLLYIGHGNASRLGNTVPRILDTDRVQAWTGHAVFLQSTCTANWQAQDSDGYRSIAIQALTQPQGGISASIASSTYMNSEHAVEFMTQLMANAQAGSTRWGTALMKTQQWAAKQGSGFYADLNTTEQIFGDPAMRVFSKSASAATPITGGTPVIPATGAF